MTPRPAATARLATMKFGAAVDDPRGSVWFDKFEILCACERGRLDSSAVFSRKTMAFSSQAPQNCRSYLQTHP
jgi:hypothetical protein